MTVSTLRPDATAASRSVLFSSGSDVAALLNDNSDTSWIKWASAGFAEVSFGDLSLPAGAIIKQATVRCRLQNQGPATTTITTDLKLNGSVAASITTTVTWSTLTTVTTAVADAATVTLTDPLLDLANVRLTPVTDPSLLLKVAELYLDVTYVTTPTVSVTAPSGTSATNLPTVTWRPTLDTDGGTQTAFQIRVFNDAQYGARGFDPATSTPYLSYDGTGAATSWRVSGTLPDDTYRAYVSVAQTVNGAQFWSTFAYSQFDVAIALPAVPTLTLTAQSSLGRVRLDAVHNSGSATTDAIEFQYSIDGTTWVAMRTAAGDGLVLTADATAFDFESANGATISYRARALHDYSGAYAASAWTTVGGGWSSTDWWLKHPLRPDLSMVVVPRSQPSTDRAARQGVFQPLGASRPVIVTDTRASATGTLVLRLSTAEEQAALDALLTQGGVMLLQAPPEAFGWPDRYVALGDVSRARLIDKSWSEPTFDTFAWTEVDRPAGALLSLPA